MTLSSHPNLGAKDSQTKCQYLRMNVSEETKLLHCLCQQTNHTRCIWGLQDTNYFAAHLPSCNNCNCTFCTCSTIGPSNYICLTHQCYTCFCNHSTVNYREVVWYALPFAGKKGIYGRQAKHNKSKHKIRVQDVFYRLCLQQRPWLTDVLEASTGWSLLATHIVSALNAVRPSTGKPWNLQTSLEDLSWLLHGMLLYTK